MISSINLKQQNVTPFTAKLELNGIDKLVDVSPERLQDIQDRFEKETKNNDESYFNFDDEEHYLDLSVYDYDKDVAYCHVNSTFEQGKFDKKSLNKLFKLDNKTVADKLVKLYNILVKADEAEDVVTNTIFKQIGKKPDEKSFENMSMGVYGLMHDDVIEARRENLDKDSILKHFDTNI